MSEQREVKIETPEALSSRDLDELCQAAVAAIADGGGFGWLTPPTRDVFERYWKGVLLVPERRLFIGRLDGVIAGAATLVRPSRNNEAQAHIGQIAGSFVAPWARGHRVGRTMTRTIETVAVSMGIRVLNLDVRATQAAAIHMYEGLGYERWAVHPRYARVGTEYVPGFYYTKTLVDDAE
jgi:ribosomal protein S18 acetylase RimI-like enzyme